jgi:pilus assembly protein CpaF
MKSKKRKQRTPEKFQVRNAEVLAAESPQTIRPMNAVHNHSLFFAPNNSPRDFGAVLREVQEYISSKYSTLILDGGKDEVKTQIKRYISKYLMDCRIAVKGMTDQQLVDAL